MIPGMGAGMDPRQMSMMMKKLGIDVRDIEAVQEVVVRTTTHDYIFDKASVSVMKAQGVETWQVSGKPRMVPRGTSAATASASSMPASSAEPHVAISEEDILLVMKETGKPHNVAKAALESCKGDLAEAILKLS